MDATRYDADEQRKRLQDELTLFEGRGRAAERSFDDVAQRLERKYGLGDKPKLRRKFFLRIEQICVKYGPRAYAKVKKAAVLAEDREWPDRYFVKTASSMLEECDMFDQLDVLT